MPASSELNFAEIERALKKGFKDTVIEVANQATRVISYPQFWEGYSDVRDIVDTGQLRASQKIRINDDFEASIDYDTEYAAAVHNGATIQSSNGSVRRIPPRPWMRIAAAEVNVDRAMARNVQRYL